MFPDDQAGEVASRKKGRLHAQEAIAASPTSPILEFLEGRVGYAVTEREERWEEAMAALRQRLLEDTPWCWKELRAVETVLEEVAQEFNGEDPLLPPVRNVLDKTHQEPAELPQLLVAVDVEVELPKPHEERVEFLRQRFLREDT